MKPNRHLACSIAVVFLALLAGAQAAAQDPFALLHSLFNPSTNAQASARQGHSVAVDGDLAVLGAPLDAVGGYNSGVVKVYQATTGALIHTLTNPSTAGGFSFGWAVGIAGTRVVVGNPVDSTGAQEAGIAYVYDLAGATPTTPVLTLLSPRPTEEAGFGSAVAISGSRIVIGAEYADTGETRAGSAYVFDLASAAPSVPVLTLTNPNPQAYASYGSSVAIAGPRVVIGAPQDRSTSLGRAYIYDLASVSPTTPLVLSNPDSPEGRSFGMAVSISATRVVIGAMLDSITAENIGVAYVFDLTNATPTVPTLTLDNPSPAENEFFGSAVAIAGTRVVVGAHREIVGSSTVGAVYIYDLVSTTPSVPVVTLTNPNPNRWSDDEFGSGVAMAGEKLIVGARLDDLQARDAGSAYVYSLASATPAVPMARLASPSPSSHGHFGSAVAVSGTRVVVGARKEGYVGAAYVYDLARATPTTAVLELKNPRPSQQNGSFGLSVAIFGTRVVIGDTGQDASAGISGSVFVYDLAGATPAVPVMTLKSPNAEAWTLFGSAVAISGTRVVVGSIWEDHAEALDAGSVFVFDLASATPTVPVATLQNPSPALQDYFGSAVAISGSRVVVGVSLDDQGAALDSGMAYVYELAGGTPNVPWATLTNPAPAMFNYFGTAVAISGTRVVVGAPNAGKAYVYELTSVTPTVPVATLNQPGPAFYRSFGSAVSISGDRVVVGSPWNDEGPVGAGNAYVFDLSSPTPVTPIAMLSNPSPLLYDWFGSAVAVDGTTIIAGTYGDDTVAADRGAAYIFGWRPALSMVSTTPGFATLSWTPVTTSGFVLQYADNPAPTRWLDAPSGEANPVTVPLTNAARFYRLSTRTTR